VAKRANVIEVTEPPTARKAFNVLFLCADNSIISIMAEALLKRWGGRDFHAFSAGIAPAGEIHPLAVDLLHTYNVWDQALRSKSCNDFLAPDAPSMDFVVTVGGQPPAGMPARWPGRPQVIHWRITEPSIDGNAKERTHTLKAAFRELETRIKLFVLVYQREMTREVATAA